MSAPARRAQTSYSASDIDVLEGLEPVRRRPGMYVGGTDAAALHHLVAEVLDNAIDEVVAGHAAMVRVVFDPASNEIEITDDGRGIPVDAHPRFPDKSALEVILTTLHSGGKFGGGAYQTAGGLHGVGISVVNALSESLTATVCRDHGRWRQSFARGLPLAAIERLGKSRDRGTTIRFRPDPEIFGPLRFDAATLYALCRRKAFLAPSVTIEWSIAGATEASMQADGESSVAPVDADLEAADADGQEAQAAATAGGDKAATPVRARLHFPGGIADALAEAVGAAPDSPAPIWSGSCPLSENGRVEWAICWLRSGRTGLSSYCNTVITPQGGTHETGLRAALLKAFRGFAEQTGQNRARVVTMEDLDGAFRGLVSCFIREPQFQGQTKDRLSSPWVARAVETAMRDQVDHYLTGDARRGQALLEILIARAEARLAAKKGDGAQRKSATKRLRLPGKLSDCSSPDIARTEIFLVEGDSAGGSAKQARNRETQAILPLRGKILNVAAASADKLRANQEIRDLVEALGCGSGRHFDSAHLRYGRVIIMTDADIDGDHIATLLMTYFHREMPGLIRTGRLYLAQPPLYRVTVGDKAVYAASDVERDRVLAEARGRGRRAEISRFKGLGEMPPAMLKETTMDPARRTLLRVAIPDGEEAMTEDLIERLMGRSPEARFAFIRDNGAALDRLDV